MACPIPELPPVTMATFPSIPLMTLLLELGCRSVVPEDRQALQATQRKHTGATAEPLGAGGVTRSAGATS